MTPEERAEYVALSYCWGLPERNVCTTKANLEEMQQERAMSRRTLHFAKDCVYWECQELKASEFQPSGLDDDEDNSRFVGENEQITNLNQFVDSFREAKVGPWLAQSRADVLAYAAQRPGRQATSHFRHCP